MKQSYYEIGVEEAAKISYQSKDNSENHSGLFCIEGGLLFPVNSCLNYLLAVEKKNKFLLRSNEPVLDSNRTTISFEEISLYEASNKILHGDVSEIFFLTNSQIINPVLSVERFVKSVSEKRRFYVQKK